MEPQPSPSSYFQAGARSRRAATSQLVSIRLPEELIRRLAEVGNQEGLSMSDTIRLVLERGLARPEERSRSK
jgi:predicted DNA-binding protein